MKRLLTSLFQKQQLKKLNICPAHIKKDKQGNQLIPLDEAVPYSSDYCQTCNKHMCHSCSDEHVNQHCSVHLGINTQLGEGSLRSLNLGEVIKIKLDGVRCVCGKPLGKGAAICAACGMASCSQSCHREWEKIGNCKFGEAFYSIPQGFSMRSILLDNIHRIQHSQINQWVIANKSATTMLCCYAMGSQPFVYLQRGYRNYGVPNAQFLGAMEPVPRALDYFIHFERRCDCQCETCKSAQVHSSTNCQSYCRNFDLEHMKLSIMQSKNFKQCTCPCEFCQSGVIFNTHRFIDCMMFCRRSSYWKTKTTP